MTSLVSLPQAEAWFCVCALYWPSVCDRLVTLTPFEVEVVVPAEAFVPTLLLAATNWQAMSVARLASSGVRTTPLITTALPAISVLMLEPGTSRFSSVSRPPRSAPTETSRVRICWPLVSKKKALVWPSFLAIRNTRLEACTTASTLSGSETSTSFSSKGNWIITDLLKPSEMRLASGKLPRLGICSTECRDMSSNPDALGSAEYALGGYAQIPMAASSNAPAIALRVIRMVCQPSCRPCLRCTQTWFFRCTQTQLTPYARDFTPYFRNWMVLPRFSWPTTG